MAARQALPVNMPNAAPVAQQAPQPQGAMVKFGVKTPEGTQTFDSNSIAQQLAMSGAQVQGVSPDGTQLRMIEAGQEVTVPITQVLEQNGYEVESAVPISPDLENIQYDWRAGVNELPNDETRKMYIEGKMKRAGVTSPTVMGSGRDWYVFNPNNNQWIAATNSQDWDLSDLVELGTEIPSVVGGALGFAGGAALSAGAGGVLGAAAGGTAGSALTKAGLAAFDPEFASVIGNNLGDVGQELAGEAALGAATGGALKYGGKYLSRLSPFSSTAKAAGSVGETLGGIAKPLGSVVSKAKPNPNFIGPMPKSFDPRGIVNEMATAFNPITQGAQFYGFLGQLPRAGVRGIAKGMGTIGENKYLRSTFGSNTLGKMRRFSADLLRPRQGAAEESAKGIFGNLAGKLPNKNNFAKGFRQARQMGMSEEQASRFAKKFAQEQTTGFTRAAETVGDVIDKLGQSGRFAERGASNVNRAMFQGMGKMGAAAQSSGRALQTAGRAGQQIEPYAYTRYGLGQAGERFLDPRDLQTPEPPIQSYSNLAGNY